MLDQSGPQIHLDDDHFRLIGKDNPMSKSILIDSSLVLPWSLDLIQDEPFEYPFRVDYKFDLSRLIYIAALHSCEPDSSTFKVIKASVENEKIDLMLLEGFGDSIGISPEFMKSWAVKQEQEKTYEGFETAYSISLAVQKHIPFIGCEPDDSVMLTEILNNDCSSEDLLFYYFVQQSFQMNEAQSKIDNQELFQKLVKLKCSAFKLETEPTYKEFLDWYLKRNGEHFSPLKIDEEVPAPYENGKLFTQKISSLVCRIRDQYILMKIQDSLNKHSTVLVVCGGSHWSTQKVALEKALGKPSFSKRAFRKNHS